MRRNLEELIGRIHAGATLAGDYIVDGTIAFDYEPAWVDALFASPRILDEDFKIFKYFDAGMGAILDVGANWGYSASSIRAAGSDCPILSFEAAPALEPALARVKTLDAGRHDYVIRGVGEGPGEVDFLFPAISRRVVSALATASLAILDQHMVRNLVYQFETYMEDIGDYTCQFWRQPLRIDAIDNILADRAYDIDVSRIAAIKLDVEGYEAKALAGARRAIERDRPLLLIESGDRDPGVAAFLAATGYLTVERLDWQVRLSSGVTAGLNGIFVHPDRLEQYRARGLLV